MTTARLSTRLLDLNGSGEARRARTSIHFPAERGSDQLCIPQEVSIGLTDKVRGQGVRWNTNGATSHAATASRETAARACYYTSVGDELTTSSPSRHHMGSNGDSKYRWQGQKAHRGDERRGRECFRGIYTSPLPARGYQAILKPPAHPSKLDRAIVGKGLQIQAETKGGQVVVRRGRRERSTRGGSIPTHDCDLDQL